MVRIVTGRRGSMVGGLLVMFVLVRLSPVGVMMSQLMFVLTRLARVAAQKRTRRNQNGQRMDQENSSDDHDGTCIYFQSRRQQRIQF